MGDFLTVAYPWIKSIHVIAVISWMAGMLYLPRLFVYHAESESGSERRLLRAIMNPAMILTYIFGGLLLATPGIVDWGSAWIWIKLAAIAGMTIAHHVFGKWRKEFERDVNTRSTKAYRWANEVPTILMIVIVIMVIARPF